MPDRSAEPRASPPPRPSRLRELAATLPSFDDAIADLIARAHHDELAVTEDDVIAEAAADAAADAATRGDGSAKRADPRITMSNGDRTQYGP